MLTQFFKDIPREIMDAALIDGDTHFGVYWHVVLPLSQNALVNHGDPDLYDHLGQLCLADGHRQEQRHHHRQSDDQLVQRSQFVHDRQPDDDRLPAGCDPTDHCLYHLPTPDHSGHIHHRSEGLDYFARSFAYKERNSMFKIKQSLDAVNYGAYFYNGEARYPWKPLWIAQSNLVMMRSISGRTAR